MAPLADNTGIDQLFMQWLDVVNQAIAENRDDFYGKVVKLWERAFGDELIAFGVYERDADDIMGWYTVKLEGGRFELVAKNKDPDAKFSAKVKQAYLEAVVENPEEYIEHPIKLDLDWLKTRIGLCP